MFCQNCGKQISDQSKFCNYCGASVNVAQTPVPRQSQQTAQQRQRTETTGRSRLGRLFLRAVIVLVVYFLAKTVTYNMITKPDKTPSAEQTNNTSANSLLNVSLQNAMSNCINGALYQDGYLRYGFARLTLSGYELLPGEEGGGDYLMSSDGNSLLTVSKQIEIVDASYDATTEDSILQSSQRTYPDARMIDFQKYQENGAYVIRYIIRCTDNGTDLYFGELILSPSETCSETIRIFLFQPAEIGYDRINQAFDSLSISGYYAPDNTETNVFGYNRITVK